MANPNLQHRLAAVAVVDAVGYSRAMALDEYATHESCKRHLQEIFIPRIREFAGDLIKTTGDGLLAAFASVLNAVSWAVEVQEKMHERNLTLPQGKQLMFRIGIDMGDLIFDDEDVFGDEVNTAAKIEKLAEPGGVCLSLQVHRSVYRKLPLILEDMGELELKNIGQPVSIFRVKGRRQNGADGAEPQAGGSSVFLPTAAPSIVVLPFRSLSKDGGQKYFCDGLTNDITTQLSKFPNLHVLSAHTAFACWNEQVTPQQLNRSLGVRYLLEGSVHRFKSRVRVNAQLIDAARDSHLWAESFDRPTAEIFRIYDAIIEQIVASLASRIEAAELRQALRKRSVNFNAYDAYLKGISDYSLDDRESFQSSRLMFEKATELDPNFARAWGYRGYTIIRGILLGWVDSAEMRQAEAHIHRAVELDPDDYANIWDLAFLHQNLRQFALAEREYSRALALNSNDADLLAEFAEFCTFAGEHERAIGLLGRAVRINPHFPDWYLWNLGRARYHAGQNERAIEELSQISRPSDHAELLSAAAHVRLGRIDEARRIIAKMTANYTAYTISQLRWRDRFKNAADENYWLEALAIAGLPQR